MPGPDLKAASEVGLRDRTGPGVRSVRKGLASIRDDLERIQRAASSGSSRAGGDHATPQANALRVHTLYRVLDPEMPSVQCRARRGG